MHFQSSLIIFTLLPIETGTGKPYRFYSEGMEEREEYALFNTFFSSALSICQKPKRINTINKIKKIAVGTNLKLNWYLLEFNLLPYIRTK